MASHAGDAGTPLSNVRSNIHDLVTHGKELGGRKSLGEEVSEVVSRSYELDSYRKSSTSSRTQKCLRSICFTRS